MVGIQHAVRGAGLKCAHGAVADGRFAGPDSTAFSGERLPDGKNEAKEGLDAVRDDCGHGPHALATPLSALRAHLTRKLKALQDTKLYDLCAAVPLIGWYGYCAAQQFPPLGRQLELAWMIAKIDPTALDMVFVIRLTSNLAIMAFIALLITLLVVRRRPMVRAEGLYGRFVALSGAFLGVGIIQLPPQELSPTAYLTSLILILGGTTFAIYAVLGLGRSISILPEARGLATRGPYGTIRHPLYLGELVALLGVTLQYFSPWALLLLILQCVFQLERMRYEERLLSRVFTEYRDYMARTARLLPYVY